MSDYLFKLTPDLVNPGTEGSLDTSVVGGVSAQRTMAMFEVTNSTNRKIVGGVDGGAFDNVIATFADNANIESA